MKGFKEG
jgi:hypothetical protein